MKILASPLEMDVFAEILLNLNIICLLIHYSQSAAQSRKQFSSVEEKWCCQPLNDVSFCNGLYSLMCPGFPEANCQSLSWLGFLLFVMLTLAFIGLVCANQL